MTAQRYLAIVEEEVERHRRPDGSVDEHEVTEAIFARANLMDAVAAFLEKTPSNAVPPEWVSEWRRIRS